MIARSAVAGIALILVIAGCSTAHDVPRESAPTVMSDRAGAPPITNPRNLTSRAEDPCRTLLSTGQIARLGYAREGTFRRDVLGAPTCTWREEERGRDVGVSVILTGDQFVDAYRKRFLPIFRPLRINDAPAVDIKSGPQALTCTTTVGVADGQSLQLNTSVGGGSDGLPDGDPCAEGHRVAEAIISTRPAR